MSDLSREQRQQLEPLLDELLELDESARAERSLALVAESPAPGDTPAGRAQFGRRSATVEPVFANVRWNKRFDRFTLRGRTKVNGQWLLFCLVHDIKS